jgi:[acyl-carrier-protein] S-malonyltransferase
MTGLPQGVSMTLAFVVPGQGSQSLGMLSALAAEHPEVLATFAEASVALDYDLWAVAQQGPEQQLNSTECTQPAMLAAGIAAWRVWQKAGGPTPDLVAGHSLGEFTALVAADSLDFAAAVDLVRWRGRFMQEAVPPGEGAVAAVLGLEPDDIEAACAEAAEGQVVEPVNFNAPGQVVIAGATAAVERAIATARARGARRAVLLPVSAPVHSSLMRGAAARLEQKLAGVAIRRPRLRFLSSVDARERDEPEAIRALLVRQLASPVRWIETVRAITAAGPVTLVECGPGKVLTGLNRRIDRRPEVQCLAVEDPTTLAAALTAARVPA